MFHSELKSSFKHTVSRAIFCPQIWKFIKIEQKNATSIFGNGLLGTFVLEFFLLFLFDYFYCRKNKKGSITLFLNFGFRLICSNLIGIIDWIPDKFNT